MWYKPGIWAVPKQSIDVKLLEGHIIHMTDDDVLHLVMKDGGWKECSS